VGTAGSVLALIQFACSSTVTLYQAFESYASIPKAVRELKNEVYALDQVLQSLQVTAIGNEFDMRPLVLPLQYCGSLCSEFRDFLNKSTTDSEGGKGKVRNWVMLTFHGKQVSDLRNSLEGYKNTIAVALGDANLHQTSVTRSVLEDFKKMAREAAEDQQEQVDKLQTYLETLGQKFDNISSHDNGLIEAAEERFPIEQEMASLQQSLKICNDALRHAEQIRVNVFEDVVADTSAKQLIVSTLGDLVSAKRVTAGKGSVQLLGQMSDEAILQSLAGSWNNQGVDTREREFRLREIDR